MSLFPNLILNFASSYAPTFSLAPSRATFFAALKSALRSVRPTPSGAFAPAFSTAHFFPPFVSSLHEGAQ